METVFANGYGMMYYLIALARIKHTIKHTEQQSLYWVTHPFNDLEIYD